MPATPRASYIFACRPRRVERVLDLAPVHQKDAVPVADGPHGLLRGPDDFANARGAVMRMVFKHRPYLILECI
jgi:hypothetical protein